MHRPSYQERALHPAREDTQALARTSPMGTPLHTRTFDGIYKTTWRVTKHLETLCILCKPARTPHSPELQKPRPLEKKRSKPGVPHVRNHMSVKRLPQPHTIAKHKISADGLRDDPIHNMHSTAYDPFCLMGNSISR